MTTETDVAVAFLRRVLPATGSYFYRYKPGAKKIWMAVSPANSVEQLWSRMQDAGGNLDAGDVYYSTASFDCPRNDLSYSYQGLSDAAHVVAKRAFYVDVEVGAAYVKKGTGYADQSAAIRAIMEFCQTVGIPYPGVVFSGRGVHAYWCLEDAVSRAVWQKYATGLKLACRQHGLLADGAVTADPARILRCPGTYNHKTTPPTEVTVHPMFFSPELGPYSLDEFSLLLEYAPTDEEVPAASAASPGGSALLNEQTMAYYGSAIDAIPNDDTADYDKWFRIGAAVYELGWGDIGYELWADWSKRSERYNSEEQHKIWAGFPKYRETHLDNLITPGTLIHYATEAGWEPESAPPPAVPVFEPSPELVAEGDPYKLWQAKVLAAGPEMNDKGCFTRGSYRNATWALATLGVRGRLDELSGREELLLPRGKWQQYTDGMAIPVRRAIMEVCSMTDAGSKAVAEALDEVCLVGAHHPIREYLKALEWDGTERLKTWLTDYTGAEDTPLNRFYGATVLVAAVRRMLRPGIVNFDHMLVLEGPQGVGKSTVVEILGGGPAPDGWYKNEEINWRDNRSSVEVLRGCWFYEWAELRGYSRDKEEHIKSCLSSPVDEARLAYGRKTSSTIRRAIFVATTNEHCDYLGDQTGARRYWVVECGEVKFKLDELQRDRDQLFAEAVVMEKKRDTYLDTPAPLRHFELEVQRGRTQVPHLVDALSQLVGTPVELPTCGGGVLRREEITGFEIKSSPWLANYPRGRALDMDIAAAMKHLGWYKEKNAHTITAAGTRTRKFWRSLK